MTYSIDLSGRVAFITGASSGLGAQFARTLARAGAGVVLASRRVEKLKELRARIEGEGGDAQVRSSMDCPLCAHATPALPPPTVAALAHVHDARAHIVQALPEALLLARTAPPLPSRGPPDLI